MISWDQQSSESCATYAGCDSIVPVADVPTGSYVAFPFLCFLAPSDGRSDIYYTTTGEDPNSTSQVYDNPVLIATDTVRLKARCLTPEGCWGPVVEFYYSKLDDDSTVSARVCCDSLTLDYVGGPTDASPFNPNGTKDLLLVLDLNLNTTRKVERISVLGRYKNPPTSDGDRWELVRYSTQKEVDGIQQWPLGVIYLGTNISGWWDTEYTFFSPGVQLVLAADSGALPGGIMGDILEIPLVGPQKYIQIVVKFEGVSDYSVVIPVEDCVQCASSTSSSSESSSSESSIASDYGSSSSGCIEYSSLKVTPGIYATGCADAMLHHCNLLPEGGHDPWDGVLNPFVMEAGCLYRAFKYCNGDLTCDCSVALEVTLRFNDVENEWTLSAVAHWSITNPSPGGVSGESEIWTGRKHGGGELGIYTKESGCYNADSLTITENV